VCPAGNTLTAIPAGNDLCEACPTNFTPGLDAGDKSCQDCSGSATGVCASDTDPGCTAAATWTCTVTADSNDVVANSKTLNGTTKCQTGYFYDAGGDDAADACTACEANCTTCTAADAGSCTHANEGFYLLAGVPTECTDYDANACDDQETNQNPKSLAEVCPAGNTLTAIPAGNDLCEACPVNEFPSESDGCTACTSPTMNGAGATGATGATLDCGDDGTSMTNIVAAPAGSGDCIDTTDGSIDGGLDTEADCEAADDRRWASTEGRRCAFGSFYTAATEDAVSSCTECEAGCYVCTAADAGSCSVAKEGYWLDTATPRVCTALAADAEGSCDSSATLKVALNQFQACPFGNLCTGGPSTEDIDSTCPSPSPGVDAAGATAPGAFAAAVAAVIVALRM